MSFFTLAQRDGKWLLLDPEAKPTYLRGVNHAGDGSWMPWNLENKYDTKAAWRESVVGRTRAWGCNYLAPSIGPGAVDPALATDDGGPLIRRTEMWTADQQAAAGMPFTVFLGVPRQYMAEGEMPDVFGDGFAAMLDRRCQEAVAPLRENPNLIGYHFCHNPPWNLLAPNAMAWIKACTQPGSAGLQAWIALMQRIYGSVDRWRQTYSVPIGDWQDIVGLDDPLRGYICESQRTRDQEAFLQRICERWHQVFHDAIRRYDPNHLILGDRNTLHLIPAPRPWMFHILRRYADVLSVNIMGPKETIYGVLEQATRHWDGPIFLGDTGAGIYGGEPHKAGYQCRDLAEWDAVYRGLMEIGLEHPQVIGMGWCGFYETPAPANRSGLVDCRTDEPLAERVEIVTRWNRWMEAQFTQAHPTA